MVEKEKRNVLSEGLTSISSQEAELLKTNNLRKKGHFCFSPVSLPWTDRLLLFRVHRDGKEEKTCKYFNH